MILYWASIFGGVVLFAIFWLAGLSEFSREHARKRIHVLNALRYVGCLAVMLSFPWVPRSPAIVIPIIAFVALLFFPRRWLVRLAGREPKWELRALQDAAGELTRRSPRPSRVPELIPPMRRLIEGMKAIRAPELAELRDLLVADFSDWVVGVDHFADVGLRAARVHEIDCELFGADARRPLFDPAEATFRWRLLRTIGDMIDCGASREPEPMEWLGQLIEELEEYRRPDTAGLIDWLQHSAREWLESDEAGSWPAEGWRSSSPTVERSYRELWPSKSAFWGAQLDERDMQMLPTVMTERQPASEAG